MINRNIFFAVLVAALGYFVDVYDLILFSVVRVASLKDLGLSGETLTNTGLFLLNTQLIGMTVGGILWGIYGDKKGRLSILFGSILIYSLANIANAFVTDVWSYAACRLLAGLGLAGEIGAGITLVSELLPANKRGIGTTIVAAMGVTGGLVAATVGDVFTWKTSYLVGGVMGLALFALRLGVRESSLFIGITHEARRGDIRLLLNPPKRLARFITCITIGLPIWFLVGLVVTLAPEIGKALHINEKLSAATTVMWFYMGLVGGDVASGLCSQFLKSRKKALGLFITLSFITTLTLLHLPIGSHAKTYYMLCGIAGFFSGYWAIFLTTAAESFGTNIRATVATSVPNLVRGGAVVLSSLFWLMRDTFGVLHSIEIIAVLTFTTALLGVRVLNETFDIHLDYIEA